MAQTLKQRNKTLIIDADSLLYEAASVNQVVYDFGEGGSTVETDLEGAKEGLKRSLEAILDETKCTNYLMYITGEYNFRYDVLPSYKHNRAGVAKPLLLPELKQHALKAFPCRMTTKIEADDACSIHVSADPKNTILAHIDKDLNQVEGMHYNWRSKEFYELSYAEGQRAFYEQVLSGDSTDGYRGCPNVGKQRAKDIIDGYLTLRPYEYVFKRGARAGETEIRWECEPDRDIWVSIVSWYLKGHFQEGHIKDAHDYFLARKKAIQQARVARMLRHDEFKGGRVKLWEYKPIKIDLRNVKSYPKSA